MDRSMHHLFDQMPPVCIDPNEGLDANDNRRHDARCRYR